MPVDGAIPLFREEEDWSKGPPRPYGLIRRLATELRYRDDLEAAVFDVFDKIAAMLDSMPIPRLTGTGRIGSRVS